MPEDPPKQLGQSRQPTVTDLGNEIIQGSPPGTYAQGIDPAFLGREAKKANPGQFDQFIDEPIVPQSENPPPGWVEAVKGAAMAPANLGIGALKGAGSTLYGIGNLAGTAVGHPLGPSPPWLQPEGLAQRGGFLFEQGAEWAGGGELVKGGLKIAETVPKLGKVAEAYRAAEAAESAAKLAAKTGQTAEKLTAGEKILLTAGRSGKEAVTGTLVGAAQSGSLHEGEKLGVAGGLIPYAGLAAEWSGPALAKWGAKQYRSFLLGRGGGSADAKLLAQRVVPEAMQRGFWGGTWDRMAEGIGRKVDSSAKAINKEIDRLEGLWTETYQEPVGTNVVSTPHVSPARAATPEEAEKMWDKSLGDFKEELEKKKAGATDEASKQQIVTVYETRQRQRMLSMDKVISRMEEFRDSFKVGETILNPEAYERADKVYQLMNEFKDGMTLRDLVKAKRILDESVFAIKHVPGRDLAASSTAAAREAAADAMRRVLEDEAPSLAKLNREFSFWKNFETIIGETSQKAEHIASSKITKGMKGTAKGAAVGLFGEAAGFRHFGETEIIGGLATGAIYVLAKAMESTAWRSVSPLVKDKLAKLLVSDNKDALTKYIMYLGGRLSMNINPRLAPPDVYTPSPPVVVNPEPLPGMSPPDVLGGGGGRIADPIRIR